MCESFSCVPSVAERELELNPNLVFDILQLRAYAHTKRAIDTAKTDAQKEALNEMPLVTEVMETEYALLLERHAHLSE